MAGGGGGFAKCIYSYQSHVHVDSSKLVLGNEESYAPENLLIYHNIASG